MPRPKSDVIYTHRIALDKWERDKLELVLDASIASVMVPAVGIGVGAAGLGAGCALAGWAIYQWLSDSPFWDLIDDVKTDIERVSHATGKVIDKGKSVLWYNLTHPTEYMARKFIDNLVGPLRSPLVK